MSMVATYTYDYTYDAWDARGGWDRIEPYVDGVVLLWHDWEEEPLDEATFDNMYCGELPPRTCAFRFYRRAEDGTWYLEEDGDDHRLKRVLYTRGLAVQRCPGCQWVYDVDPARPHCPGCGPVPGVTASGDARSAGTSRGDGG